MAPPVRTRVRSRSQTSQVMLPVPNLAKVKTFQKPIHVFRFDPQFTRKSSAIVASGLLPVIQCKATEEVREEIVALIKNCSNAEYNFSTVSSQDFEFVQMVAKVAQIPSTRVGFQWNGMAVKRLAGQGSVCDMLKPDSSQSDLSDPDVEPASSETPTSGPRPSHPHTSACLPQAHTCSQINLSPSTSQANTPHNQAQCQSSTSGESPSISPGHSLQRRPTPSKPHFLASPGPAIQSTSSGASLESLDITQSSEMLSVNTRPTPVYISSVESDCGDGDLNSSLVVLRGSPPMSLVPLPPLPPLSEKLQHREAPGKSELLEVFPNSDVDAVLETCRGDFDSALDVLLSGPSLDAILDALADNMQESSFQLRVPREDLLGSAGP